MSETKNFVDGRFQSPVELSGGSCSGYVKLCRKDGFNNTCMLLTRERVLVINYHDESKKWILTSHSHPVDQEAYETARKNTIRKFPEAFKMPFETMYGDISILDIFNGKCRPILFERSSLPLTLDKVGSILSNGKAAYRLHFTLHEPSVTIKLSGYVDVVPELCWMITHGTFSNYEWTIEYGEKIQGVPMVQSATIEREHYDAETKESKKMPLYVITVDKAEIYDHVNPEEYEASHYLDDTPEARDAKKMSLVLWCTLGGILAFLGLVYFLTRIQQRRRLTCEALLKAQALINSL